MPQYCRRQTFAIVAARKCSFSKISGVIESLQNELITQLFSFMDFLLSIHCPQCGADISFEEESRVVYCQYCSSTLHITGRSGVFRNYVKPSENIPRMKKALRGALKGLGSKKALISEKKLFFAPYWRVKGMVYKWVFGKDVQGELVKKLKTKHLDQSFPAYCGVNLGLRSLGIRPGTLKLPFFDREEMSKSNFVMEVELDFKEAVKQGSLLTQVGLDETGIQIYLEKTRIVGERYSIIYFPFWMVRLSLPGQKPSVLILDAVANTVTRILTENQWEDMEARSKKARSSVNFSNIHFIAFKCPNCGWDLPLNRFDVIHLCGTCKQAWIEKGGRFRAVRFEIAALTQGTGQDVIYLPVWVFQAQITSHGKHLKTVADLQTFSGVLPLGVKQGGDKERFCFFMPAAKIRNILAADKLSIGLTNKQATYQCVPVERIAELKTMGVFLSPRAAGNMAEILLCSLTPRNNRKKQEFVKDAKISIDKMHVLWWPFYEQRLFLRDAICGCGIQKGTLDVGY